ncbi:MAG: hypothetical protein JO323_15410 [Acidobacteriia bacterium]|nr:hypothetical protein [Terriglobia bacterium]
MRLVNFSFVLIAATLAAAQSLDPLVADPQHYKLEFENQWVKVVRETMGPHEKMPMHEHTAPGALIILMTDRNNRLTSKSGASETPRNHAGEIQWAGPSVHKSENLNDAPFEAIRIEPKQLPPGVSPKPLPPEKDDATILDPETYHVEFENEYVRAIRVNIPPNEKGKMHKHPATRAVVVYLTDQNMRQTLADGKTRENHYKAGQVRWVGPDVAHQDQNLSGMPSKLIRVELKMSR